MARLDEDVKFGLGPEIEKTEEETRLRPIILAVGDVRQWLGSGRTLPADSQIAFAEFHEISAELLETLTLDIVMSPVLTNNFDCLDLAQALQASGFRGRFRVVAPDMPNPRVIQAEIHAMCPALDVAFIYVGDDEVRRLH
jgi:hypothetical protein